jgi:hypothetical protein
MITNNLRQLIDAPGMSFSLGAGRVNVSAYG